MFLDAQRLRRQSAENFRASCPRSLYVLFTAVVWSSNRSDGLGAGTGKRSVVSKQWDRYRDLKLNGRAPAPEAFMPLFPCYLCLCAEGRLMRPFQFF